MATSTCTNQYWNNGCVQ